MIVKVSIDAHILRTIEIHIHQYILYDCGKEKNVNVKLQL